MPVCQNSKGQGAERRAQKTLGVSGEALGVKRKE